MKKNGNNHPIKRVRQALKKSPERFGLRRYSTSQGFAELIGRSPSAIRNIECGFSKNWVKTAELIEGKIGVSAEWLLGDPNPEEPILGRDRLLWRPEVYLDPLDKRHGSVNWRRLLDRFPDSLPELVGKFVERALLVELSLGYSELLIRIVTSMDECRVFQNPALVDEFGQITDEWSKKAFAQNQEELAALPPGFEVTRSENCREMLKSHPSGWFKELDADSKSEWLAEADEHYKTVFPHLS